MVGIFVCVLKINNGNASQKHMTTTHTVCITITTMEYRNQYTLTDKRRFTHTPMRNT